MKDNFRKYLALYYKTIMFQKEYQHLLFVVYATYNNFLR